MTLAVFVIVFPSLERVSVQVPLETESRLVVTTTSSSSFFAVNVIDSLVGGSWSGELDVSVFS